MGSRATAVLAATMIVGGCYEGPTRAGADGGEDLTDGANGTDASDSDGGSSGGSETGDDPVAGCENVDAGPTALRRLTRAQYRNTVRDLLGLDAAAIADALVADEKVGAFDANGIATVTDLSVEKYMDAAEALAADAALDLATLLPCDPADGSACAREFAEDFLPRAFRRPADAEQIDEILAIFDAAQTFNDGIRLMVQASLQSPYFLYHLEVVPEAGDELVALAGYEVASRLSYFLWESMPDEALRDAAAAGRLDDTEGIQAEVERMLDDPKAVQAVRHFHDQWLGMEALSVAGKDTTLFPAWDPVLADAMREEVGRFGEFVVLYDDARLETLLTAPYTLAGGPLADLYGVPGPNTGIDKLELPASERAGILTLASVMAAHSHDNQTSPVVRGILVREHVLCGAVPPPPDNVDDNPPGLDPTLPTKERYARHSNDPACKGCHLAIDPLGFGFEHYDAIGRYRTMDGNVSVDATGDLVSTDVDGPYDGPIELMEKLATSDDVRACLNTQWFRFAMGRGDYENDSCTLEHTASAFADSDYDIRRLMVALATSDAMRFVRPAQEDE